MPRVLRTWSTRLLILPACALALAACSSSPSANSTSTTATSAAVTSTSSSSTTSSSAFGTTSTTSETSATLVPQTSTATEFYSPSKNISCEIDSNFGPGAVTSALCLTDTPPKSVTLMRDGSLTECTGVQCLSNAGEDTPTLGYGQAITLGPFVCGSSRAGIRCALANGDGFLISSTATTVLGNAKLAPATTTTS